MRKLAVTLALIAASFALGLTSAVALAATRNYSGKLKDGGKVEFRVKLRHGDPVKVLEIELPSPNPYNFSGVPVRCDGGEKSKINYHLPELKVDAKGRFHYKDSAPDGFSVKARGRFVSEERVKGTFRWEGGGYPYPGCDTGNARWTAER